MDVHWRLPRKGRIKSPIRLRAISVVLITYDTLSSEKIRLSLQKQVLLVTRSLVTHRSQQGFTTRSEAFCIGMTLQFVDAT